MYGKRMCTDVDAHPKRVPQMDQFKNKPNKIEYIQFCFTKPVITSNVFTVFEKHRVLSLHDKGTLTKFLQTHAHPYYKKKNDDIYLLLTEHNVTT